MERLRKKAKEEKPKLNFTNSIIAGSGGLLNPGILGSALDTKNFIVRHPHYMLLTQID